MKGGDDSIIRLKRKLALYALGSGLPMAATMLAMNAAHAQTDYTASTTAAISSAGGTVLGMFFTNLPVILGIVIAVSLTMWGIKWVLSHFKGGRR